MTQPSLDADRRTDADGLLRAIEAGSGGAEAAPDGGVARLPLPPDVPDTVRKLLDPRHFDARRRAVSAAALPQRGVVKVFHGARHAGRTVAAYRAAQTLGKDVHRVDLSHVVSRYVGETEKNLDAVFRCAGESGALLLVEEAEALLARGSGAAARATATRASTSSSCCSGWNGAGDPRDASPAVRRRGLHAAAAVRGVPAATLRAPATSSLWAAGR